MGRKISRGPNPLIRHLLQILNTETRMCAPAVEEQFERGGILTYFCWGWQEEDKPEEERRAKPLEQEPQLAARIVIEDCMCLLLDVDDIDRVWTASGGQREDEHLLRQRRSEPNSDSPHIGHPPDPDNSVAVRTLSISGKEFQCMTPRPSPWKPVTLRACQI
jgi:hypothetical protein